MIANRTPKELRNQLFQADKIIAKATTVKWLRKVEEAILEEPKRLIMDVWGCPYGEHAASIYLSLSPDTEINAPKPACGTVGCIAGHVLMVSPAGRKYLDFKTIQVNGKDAIQVVEDFPSDTSEIAANILKITEDQSRMLFSPPFVHDGIFTDNHWPRIFEEAYSKARTAKQRANVVVNRIESFLESLQ